MNFIQEKISKLSISRKIALSFVVVILIGALLLTLPISNQGWQWLNPLDALFTATSATCVTGLVTKVTADQFTMFGQLVILLMIQIGGLGLMTIVAIFIIHLKSRLSLNDRLMMKEMLNQDSLSDMHNFIRSILRYTLIFEGCGAVVLAFRFIPQYASEYGIVRGIFNSIFISISSFCNAGFDTISSTSLMPYVDDPLVNIVVMILIILGGLGFAVWFDLRDRLRDMRKAKFSITRFWKYLSLHTKIVLIMTAFLIAIPAVIIFCVEYNNPKTLGELSLSGKLFAALFQSVTLRTAGFASIDIATLNQGTKFLMIICMFIGGSPGGTAGGVKTTTVAVLALLVLNQLKNRDEVVAFKRSVSHNVVLRAAMILFINIFSLTIGLFTLTLSENAAFLDLFFEVVSAMATVGLTAGITPILSVVGKVVIIMLMYIGRIGVITLIISIIRGKGSVQKTLSYPSGHVIVG